MTAFLLANLTAAGLLSGLTGFVLARRPPGTLGRCVVLLHGFLLCYVAGDSITQLATGTELKEFGLALLYTGSLLGITCWWLLALTFAGEQRVRPVVAQPPWVRAVIGFMVAGWLVAVTNPWHGQFLEPRLDGRNRYLALWWVWCGAGHALALCSIIVFGAVAFRGKTKRIRVNACILLASIVIPAAANLAYIADPSWQRDPTGLAICVSSVLLLWGVYRTRLFALESFAFRTVLLHDPNPVIIAKPRGEVLFANPAAWHLLGAAVQVGSQDIYGTLAARLRTMENRQLSAAELRMQLMAGDDESEVLLVDLTGSWLQVELHPIPRRFGSGEAISLRLRDVTRQRRAEAERLQYERQMQQAQRLESVGSLAGGIAHDFNNLLTAVLVNAELALQEVGTGSRTAGLLDEIRSVGRHGTELVDQLLAYAGQRPRRHAPLDCAVIAREMDKLLPTIAAGSVQLRLHAGDDLPAVMGDPSQLRQVMMNLLLNAAESHENGNAEIVLEIGACDVTAAEMAEWSVGSDGEPGPHVFFRVRDHGRGMSAAILDSVLDPFFSTKASGRGRGLGLAVVVGIVRGHRGGLRVSSIEGEGSIFTVYLPALDAPARDYPAAAPSDDPTPACPGARTATVLLIEDDDSVRRGAKRALEAAGFEVLLADGAGSAVALLERHAQRVATVLLDASLLDAAIPGSVGPLLQQRLRSLMPEVPVIVMSGEQGDPGGAGGAAKAGVVSKPFSRHQVVQAVLTALGKAEPRKSG
ncbi:MAG: histidine kinase N-terminal 7TM domain-containing protein [Planctomycetota bacterium]